MGKKKTKVKPTAAELVLLQILWEHGPSTVREIHDAVDGETGLHHDFENCCKR